MISIVIIEYKSIEEIRICIERIRKFCADIAFELIVSSNSQYPKEQQQQLVSEFPSIIWTFNERNGGFAYGMNQGLALAKGEYLVILNPDVELCESIEPLAHFLANHKNVGAIAPQLLSSDGKIQDSCRRFVTPLRLFSRQVRRLFIHEASIRNRNFDYSKIQTIDCVIGAFIMIKREVYETVGELDEHYFMYAEDIDWCTRIWQAGYQVVYNPQIKVYYEGSRRARTTLKYAKIFIQSHIFYWKKFGFIWGYPSILKLFYS